MAGLQADRTILAGQTNVAGGRRLGYRPAMRALLIRLADRLPARARRQAMAVGPEFLRFGTVGAIGFLFDTATVYATRPLAGIYGAGLVAYGVAATVTWALNRVWTFRGRGGHAAHRQWLLFLAANLVGFTLNRGTFAALVTFVPLCAAQPVLAVAAGAVAGLFVNFGLNRSIVFPAKR